MTDSQAATHAASDLGFVVAPWRPTLERCEAADRACLDDIFFEASGTKSFASDAARAAFRERWLGRYLDAGDAVVLVARSSGTEPSIIGYVIGMLADPARDTRFDDIAYFKDLSPQTARFPAHLHINCAPGWRGRGVGARMLAAFCDEAAGRGAAGVHVVTGAGLRNVGFYVRNGFREVGRAASNGKPVLMLARELP